MTAEGNMITETIDKCICTIAVGKGFITSHQLQEALEIQAAEDLVGKKHRLVGRILLDLGFVTPLQLKEALAWTPHLAVSR
jgi:hypothetical protein